MRKDTLNGKGVPTTPAAVTRVLNGRPEDAALILKGVLKGDWLLLSTAGVLRKHTQ